MVCRRVERLGDELEQILTVAAVVGRTFDVELLDLLVDGDEDELLDALEGALKASVLVESPQRVGRFRFAHALIKHALYDAIGAARRGRLHRRVAEALEQLCRTESGERLVAQLPGGHGRLGRRLGGGPRLPLARGRRLGAGGRLPGQGSRAGGAGRRDGGDPSRSSTRRSS